MEEEIKKLLDESNDLYTGGSYYPNSFMLSMNSDYDFLKLDKNIDGYSTFFHEYIHFMQNILTPVGVQNNLVHILRDLILLNQKYPEKSVQYKKNYDQLSKNKVTNGTVKEYDKPFKLNSYNNNSVILTDGQKQQEIILGNIHIFEYMSKICERIIFKTDISDSPINPYQILEFIIKKENIFLLNHDEYILAILEASLHTKQPIDTFFKLLKNNYSNITDCAELKNFLNSNIEEQKLNYSYIKLKMYANKLYKGKNFEDMRNWLNLLIEKSKILTKDSNFPITDLIEMIQINGKHLLLLFASTIYSCPLIHCNYGQVHFDCVAAGSKLYYFQLIPTAINLLYSTPIKKCPLENFCEHKKENCFNAVKLISEQEKMHNGLCPLACVLKNYGYYEGN